METGCESQPDLSGQVPSLLRAPVPSSIKWGMVSLSQDWGEASRDANTLNSDPRVCPRKLLEALGPLSLSFKLIPHHLGVLRTPLPQILMFWETGAFATGTSQDEMPTGGFLF